MIKIIMKNWLEYIRRNPHAPLPLKPPKGTLSTPPPPQKKKEKIAKPLFPISLGYYSPRKRNRRQWGGGGGVNNVHYSLCVKSVHMLRVLRHCKTERDKASISPRPFLRGKCKSSSGEKAEWKRATRLRSRRK